MSELVLVGPVVAGLAGLGVAFLAHGFAQARARNARARRLANVVGLHDKQLATNAKGTGAGSSEGAARLRQFGSLLKAHPSVATRVATVTALGTALVGLILGQVMWLPFAAAAGAIVIIVRRMSASKRALEQQAPAALEMLSAALRAGYSVPQALARVARESPEPTASEFDRVERELSLGASLADSLTHLAQRTALTEYQLVSIVIWIHAQVGGNLPVVLDSLVVTLRERFDLQEQVLALTAQQRLASLVLTLLPVGVLMLLLVVDRPTVEPMFTEPAGRAMLAIAATLLSTGWVVMRAVGRVEA